MIVYVTYYVLFARIFTQLRSFLRLTLLACFNASKHCAGWQVSKGFHAAVAKARMAERL